MSGAPPDPSATPAGGRLAADLAAALAWAPRLLLVGLAPGFYLWTTTHPGRAAFVYKNDLSVGARGALLGWMLGSLAVIILLGVLRWQRGRQRDPELRLPRVLDEHGRDLIGLLALPFIAALVAPKIESAHPNLTLLYAALASLFAALGVHRLAARPGPGRERLAALAARSERWLPLTLVTAIFAGYAGALSHWSLVDHWNVWTQIFDLGIYDNILWHTVHGDFLGSSFIAYGDHTAAHFDPILALLAPIYAIWPRAETLLVVQSVWLAAGVFPLYLLARDRLRSRWVGVVLAGLYALHPALHGVNMFDFHSLALGIPLMIWVAYEVARGPSWRLVPALALFLAVREDMSLLACFIGLYAIAEGHLRAGLGVIGAAIAYLAVVKFAIMPDHGLMMTGDKVYGYASFYAEMIPRADEGAMGLVKNALSNPIYALQVLAKEDKLRFLVQLLLPLLFLPLLAGRARLLWLYGLVFIGLASRPNMYALNFQYSSVLFPMLFAATPMALADLHASPALRRVGLDPARLRAGLVAGMIVASALTSWKFGVLVENSAFMAGWQPLIRHPGPADELRYRRVQEMIARIPPEAAVSASSEIGAQLSNRAKIYRWPEVRDAEYLLLGAWRFEAKEKAKLDELERGKFERLDEHEGILLLQRRSGPAPRPAAPRRR